MKKKKKLFYFPNVHLVASFSSRARTRTMLWCIDQYEDTQRHTHTNSVTSKCRWVCRGRGHNGFKSVLVAARHCAAKRRNKMILTRPSPVRSLCTRSDGPLLAGPTECRKRERERTNVTLVWSHVNLCVVSLSWVLSNEWIIRNQTAKTLKWPAVVKLFMDMHKISLISAQIKIKEYRLGDEVRRERLNTCSEVALPFEVSTLCQYFHFIQSFQTVVFFMLAVDKIICSNRELVKFPLLWCHKGPNPRVRNCTSTCC